MHYKVSVIVPIYGVEKYIERCARSLFEQTLDSIEYIFVNDCTPDKSISILENVIKDYPNRLNDIKIINHAHNSGLPKARKSGLKLAHGEYIAHCDSDDWLDKNAFKLMYEKAISEKADVVICDLCNSDGNYNTLYPNTHKKDTKTWIIDMLYKKASWSLCNKMFRRDIYNYVDTYPQYSMGEDSVLVMQMAYYCSQIAYVEKPLYYYYINPTSIVNTKSEEAQFKKFNEAISNTRIIIDFYNTRTNNKHIMRGLNYISYYSKSLLLPFISKKKFQKIWRSTFPGVEYRLIIDGNCPMADRLKSLLIILGIYPKVTNLFGLTHCK